MDFIKQSYYARGRQKTRAVGEVLGQTTWRSHGVVRTGRRSDLPGVDLHTIIDLSPPWQPSQGIELISSYLGWQRRFIGWKLLFLVDTWGNAAPFFFFSLSGDCLFFLIHPFVAIFAGVGGGLVFQYMQLYIAGWEANYCNCKYLVLRKFTLYV